MDLIFATGNEHKIREISKMLSNRFNLLGLKDIQCFVDIPETSNTIQGNAILKAQYVYDNYGKNCFAEDTGLEIKALDMRPGVFSARYAGEAKSSEANIAKVLEELGSLEGREARFRTVIAYILDGNIMTFEGIIEGHIAHQKMGTDGFGYDPIFIPENETRTFAQMSAKEKNEISHRARAFKKFMNHLNL